jgi:phosphoribosylanthranilate isomerase
MNPKAQRANVTKVKICGLRTAEAARVAASAGADYLGFVFVEGVRRQLKAFEGQAVIRSYRTRGDRRDRRRGRGPQVVGLFGNQDADWVNQVARQMDLDCVQVTGDGDEVHARRIHRPVFRQVRIKAETTPDELSETVQTQLDAGRTVVLDRYDAKVPGGGGVSFDWAVAEKVASREGVLLAGGLTPENVGDAIRQLRPWGVDVSSGVETDGVKDHGKIIAFIEAVRSAR